MLGSYAHLPEPLERKRRTEESLLAYSSLSALPLAGRWLVTTWKKDPKLQCKSLTFSALVESTKQFLVTFYIKGSARDGPRADIKLEISLLGHFSSVMYFQVIFLLFLTFPLTFSRNSVEVTVAGVLSCCCFQPLNRTGNGKENRKEVF